MRAASALEPPLISSDTGRSPSFLESKSWPSRSQEPSRAFCEENRFVVEISTNFAVKYLSLYLSSNSFEGSRGGRQGEVVRERRRRRNSTSRCEIDDSSHGRWRDPEIACPRASDSMRYDPGEAFRSIVESREKNSFTLYTWISSFAVRKPIREKFFLSLYIYRFVIFETIVSNYRSEFH